MLRRFEIPLFLLLFAALLMILQIRESKPYEFEGDDLRYIYYASSIYKHGVFGLSKPGEETRAPAPGNANAPFYPALIAGWMLLDQPFAETVVCLREQGHRSGCDLNFEKFFMAQNILALFSLFLIYLTALRLTRDKRTAWLAAFLAVVSGVFTDMTLTFMTEILLLPGCFALVYLCLLFYQEKKLRYALFIGLALGFLTMTRPSYLYLFYAFIVFFGVAAALKKDKASVLGMLAMIAAFIVFVSPWAMRNKVQFDTFALTTGGYAENVLVERTNYNQMSWPEVGVAMIYWLPDFGDSIAPKLFPLDLYDKLGWKDGTYYSQRYQRVGILEEELGSRDKIVGHLIRHEVLTPKHIAVSIPLAMRGSLIAKYWGLIGFVLFIAHFIYSIRRGEYGLLIMSLPLWFMVAFHAGVSVSIPRYNLALMIIYAISMGSALNSLGASVGKKISGK